MYWQEVNGTMYVANKGQNGEMDKQDFQIEKQGD